MPAPPPPPPNPPQQQSATTPNPFFNTVLNNHPTPSTPAGASGSSSTTTPARNNAPRPTSGATEQTTTTAFSATQRGLQARGKAYNSELGERNRGAESYEERQRRSEASAILESAEMLIWYAGSRGEVCSVNFYPFVSREEKKLYIYGYMEGERDKQLADCISRASHKRANTSKTFSLALRIRSLCGAMNGKFRLKRE